MRDTSQNTWRDVLLSRLQDAVWGYHGDNGLTGTIKDHSRRIEQLELWRRELDTLKELARWMALGLVALGGFLLTEPAAKILTALAGIGK